MDVVTDKNTVTEIKSWLDEHGIEYPSGAQKADLLKLVPGEQQDDIDKAEIEAVEDPQSEADTSSTTSSASSAPVSEASVAQSDVPESSSTAVQPEAPAEVEPAQPEAPVNKDNSGYDPNIPMWEQMLVKEPESYVPEPVVPTYIVKPGDKLVDIATKHNMAYARLKKLNGLTVDYVAPGRVLKLA